MLLHKLAQCSEEAHALDATKNDILHLGKTFSVCRIYNTSRLTISSAHCTAAEARKQGHMYYLF